MTAFRITVAASLVAAFALSSCASPSTRIASSLEGYGFRPEQSRCVGDRLQAKLSLGQLEQLGRAARAARTGDATPGRLTSGDFIRVASQVKDPKIAIEVAAAAAGCGIITGPPPSF